ncbi:MAG: VWA domain-containing protein [Verrucomicrobiales bacterium]|nr:VWA domain-containing protein [Verrucomicrobiales bacterium]
MNLILAETSFELAYPWALLLLGLIPLLMVLKGKMGQQGAVIFSSLHILNRLGPVTRSRAGGFRTALMMLALACGILALTRPQWVDKKTTTTESGIELLLAIDVSRSMQVEDFVIGGTRANRLQAAKKVTRDFIRGRKTDRIGLLAFAGRPYLASPLTVSHSWLEGENGLGRVRIGLVEDGTAIGSAIAAAASRLDKRPAKSKVVVLLTDGVNNAGKISPIEAAKMAKTVGVKIYTIAVGTYGDYVVQTPRGPQRLSQEYDEATLQEIAAIADGEYFRAQDTEGLDRIFRLIDDLEKTEVKTRTTVSADELFYWPAFFAFLFGLLALIGGETFWKRFP